MAQDFPEYLKPSLDSVSPEEINPTHPEQDVLDQDCVVHLARVGCSVPSFFFHGYVDDDDGAATGGIQD